MGGLFFGFFSLLGAKNRKRTYIISWGFFFFLLYKNPRERGGGGRFLDSFGLDLGFWGKRKKNWTHLNLVPKLIVN